VAELAERLGIGPCHLLRLFLRHTGATPSEVAPTRRIQMAKRLIDQSPMPLSEIAVAAGFHSVRRFNDAFRATYGRPPSRFRRQHGYVQLAGTVRDMPAPKGEARFHRTGGSGSALGQRRQSCASANASASPQQADLLPCQINRFLSASERHARPDSTLHCAASWMQAKRRFLIDMIAMTAGHARFGVTDRCIRYREFAPW
jgi:AraC-like DNA-binding protein